MFLAYMLPSVWLFNNAQIQRQKNNVLSLVINFNRCSNLNYGFLCLGIHIHESGGGWGSGTNGSMRSASPTSYSEEYESSMSC